jgi:hypothetical protein
LEHLSEKIKTVEFLIVVVKQRHPCQNLQLERGCFAEFKMAIGLELRQRILVGWQQSARN